MPRGFVVKVWMLHLSTYLKAIIRDCIYVLDDWIIHLFISDLASWRVLSSRCEYGPAICVAFTLSLFTARLGGSLCCVYLTKHAMNREEARHAADRVDFWPLHSRYGVLKFLSLTRFYPRFCMCYPLNLAAHIKLQDFAKVPREF